MSAEGEIRDGNGAGFGLIETLRWEPGGGFVRLDRHLARLQASAEALGFPRPLAKARDKLGKVAGGPSPLRIRIELSRSGDVEIAAQPFVPLPHDAVWAIGVAARRLDSSDPLLGHKTTRRFVYDSARAEFPRAGIDEVILLNERGEVCEGTITNLFLDPGDGLPLKTPALGCGLLPGVLRGELIDRGQAVEAVLELEDLRSAPLLLVGNSLRGLLAARLGPAS